MRLECLNCDSGSTNAVRLGQYCTNIFTKRCLTTSELHIVPFKVKLKCFKTVIRAVNVLFYFWLYCINQCFVQQIAVQHCD